MKSPNGRVLFTHTLSWTVTRVFVAFRRLYTVFAGSDLAKRWTSLVVLALVLALPIGVYTITREGAQHAYAATSSTMNFQARLLNNSGNLVPDGNYHVEFKLYDASSGGTALWTETYSTGNLVRVKNGYLSVYLGSLTSFPGTINWDQEHWLTMNIGGMSGSPSWDGEMTPRIKLTSVPYAQSAGQLANRTSGSDGTVVTFASPSGNNTVTIPALTGTIALLQNAQTFTGAITFGAAGTGLTVTNNATIGGDLTVNGGDIIANSTLGITVAGAGNDLVFTAADQIRFYGFDCTTYANGGALTTDANGNIMCSDDDGGGGGGPTGVTLQGSSPGVADTGHFNITGTGITGTSLLTPLLDTPTAAALNIGTTNATQINLNKNVVVAAGQSLTITGGNTSSRPGSPTEGMLYYDTTTHQMLQYNGTKWVSDRSTATKIVAASNSSQAVKDAADYVATGTGDQSTINTALTAAAGGKVYLAEGTYTINASITIPNNTTLAGAGYGTLITLPNSLNTSINAITNTTTGGNGTGIIIQDLRLDGNRANAGSGTMNGIYLDGVGSGSGTSAVQGAKVMNTWLNSWRSSGISLNSSNTNTITGNTVHNTYLGDGAIYLNSSSNNTITGNTVQNNLSDGAISLNSSSNNTITGNTVQNNDGNAIYLNSSSNNTIAGNTAYNNNDRGIVLYSSSNYNTITGNTVQGGGSGGAGMNLDSSNYNTITGNNIQGISGGDGMDLASSGRNAITGNTITGNIAYGVYVHSNPGYNTITGNNIQGNASGGVRVASSYNVIASNRIQDNGGVTTNQGIYLSSGAADNNTITGNSITDTSATTTNYAINIVSGADNNYLADNTLGTGTINDLGTGTIYGGQVNSSGNYLIQPAGSIELMANTNITGALTVSSTSTFSGLATFDGNLRVSDGSGNYATISVQSLAGDYTVSIPTITGNDTFCLYSLGNCAAGGGSFIQNGITNQANANFYISSSSTGNVTGRIQAISGQTADLLQFLSPFGASVLSGFNASGNLFIGTTTAPNKLNVNALTTADAAAQVAISTGGTGNKGLVVQAVASQTANVLEVQNSAGTPVFSVSAGGTIVGSSDFASGTGVFRSFESGAGNTANVTIRSGNSGGGNSGNVNVDAGTATGTTGTVNIGTTNASSVNIGKSGSNTVVNGLLGVNTTTPQSQVEIKGTAGVSSGAITMTATSGVNTFTTSSSMTLNKGDWIVPDTTSTQAMYVSVTNTGTSFTVHTPYTANVSAQTFTIYRPSLNITDNAGVSKLALLGNGTLSIGDFLVGGVNSNLKMAVDGAVAINGNIWTTSISNDNNTTNAFIQLNATGTVVSRNIADANAALTVTQSNASSTGDILQLKNNGGTVARFKQNGGLVIDSTDGITVSGGLTYLQPQDGASEALWIRAKAGQSASLAVIQNSSGNVLSGFDANGQLFYRSGAYTGTLQTTSLTANRTWTLPDEDGVLCTVATCTGGGGAGGYVELAPSGVQTDSSANPSIFINDTGGGNLLQLQSGATDRFVVANSGNVGIGTASPAAALDVRGQSAQNGTGTITTSTSSGTVTGSGTAFTTQLHSGDVICVASDCATVASITNNTTLGLTGSAFPSNNTGVAFTFTQPAVRVQPTNRNVGLVLQANANTNHIMAGYTSAGTYSFYMSAGGDLTLAGRIQSNTGSFQSASNVAATFFSGNAPTGNSGAVTVKSGDASAGNSGNVIVDAGTASGTTGSVNIGTTNASSVNIGKSGAVTTVNGLLGVNTSTPQSQLEVKAPTGTSSGAVTMTASSGASTFTTSSSMTLNRGDYIIPTTSTGQANTVATSATGTSFSATATFSANVSGETFTIYRPTANVTDNSGTSQFMVQGNGNVSVGNSFLGGVASGIKLSVGGSAQISSILYVNTISNTTNPNNSQLALNSTGAVVSRNVADSNAALTISQLHASSTGNILTLNNSSGTVASFKQNGSLAIGGAAASSTGAIRLENGMGINYRDSTNSSDVVALRVGSDNLTYLSNGALVAGNGGGTATIFLGSNNGNVTIGNGTTDGNAKLYVKGSSTTEPTQVLQAAASQTANLFQLQNSSGYVQSFFNAGGNELTLGNNTGSGTSQGSLRLTDGTSNGFYAILQASTMSGSNQMFTLPSTGGTLCTTATCGGGPAGVSLQGSSPGIADTGHFNITGTGITGTSLLTPLLDTPSAGVLNIGTTNATAINLNKNVVVASGQSLRIIGGNTGSRPGSPTEGMLYYDTDTHQMLQYNGTKWVSDRSTATKIVAASNSPQAAKDGADYVGDGEAVVGTGTVDGDQVQINAAISALPAGGGSIYLTEGTYYLDGSIVLPNNVKISGAGDATIITVNNTLGSGIDYFTNSDTTNGNYGITIRDIKLDGNKANNASTMDGIVFNRVAPGTGGSATSGANISSVTFVGFQGRNIDMQNANNNRITNNTFIDGTGAGIYINVGVNNLISGNTFSDIDAVMTMQDLDNSIITGNSIDAAVSTSGAINIQSGSNHNLISGNSIKNSASIALRIATSNSNTVSGNDFDNNGGSGSDSTISIQGNANDNRITDNRIFDTAGSGYAIDIANVAADNTVLSNNVYSGTGATSINDAGTGTIYSGQLNASSAYVLQAAGGINLNSATTVNANLTVASSGNVAFQRNTTNITTTGVLTDLNIGTGALFRFTGASTQTISSITGGTDGRIVTLINAAAQTMVIQNDTGGTAANRIITGTGANVSVPAGSAITLVYDSASSRWRVIGDVSGGGGAGGVTLQGSTPGTADTGNFNISGTGIAGTALQSSLFDTASAGTLSIGTTNATAINLDKNVTVAAGQSLRLVGGNTGSRPGSPTEGTLYFDTTTHQLLQYNGTKWMADKSDAVIVAASNSSQADKDAADYVADGDTGAANDGDQVQINAALTAASGKKVILLAGTYTADATILIPNSTTLAGVGQGTVIRLADLDVTDNLIENSDTATGTGITIQDMKLDGQDTLNTAGTQYAIGLNNMGDYSSGRTGMTVRNLRIENFRDAGIYLSNTSDNNTVTNTTFYGMDAGTAPVGIYNESGRNNVYSGNIFSTNYWGIRLEGSGSINNAVTGNTFRGGQRGVFMFAGVSNTVTGNSFENMSNAAVNAYQGSNNTISGNSFSNNTGYGILIDDSSNNTISGNNISNSGGAANNNAIYLQANADNNSVIGNTITDSSATTTNYAINISANTVNGTYLSGNTTSTGTVRNQATDTIYGGQATGSTYAIQPASSITMDTGSAAAINIGTATANAINLGASGAGTNINTTVNGNLLVKPRTGSDSATALQVQNAAGTSLFNVNTVTGTVTIAGTTNNTQLVVKQFSGQTNANPMILFQNSSGTEIARMHVSTSGDQFWGAYAGASLNGGTDNIGIGSSALQGVTTGVHNIGIGSGALTSVGSGTQNTFIGGNGGTNISGHRNTGIGYGALVGVGAGDENVAIGASAGSVSGAGANFYWNSFLGFNAGSQDRDNFLTVANLQQAAAIGTYAQVQSNNTIVLGGVGTDATKTVIGSTKSTGTNLFSVSPVVYSAGTASQSSSTITGSGTNWTTGNGVRPGMRFIFANGTDGGTITSVNSTTSLTVTSSQTVSSQKYRIHNVGFQVDNAGNAYIQSSSTTAFQVMNAGGTAVLSVDSTNAQLLLNGNTTVGATKTLTVTSGATSLTGDTTGDAVTISNNTSTGNILTLKDNGTTVASVADGGAMLLQNTVDSDAALQVNNASGSSLLAVSTTLQQLRIGTASGFDAPTKLPNPGTLPAGNGTGTSFSPDGQYMVVSHATSPYITIYKRSGDTFTKLPNPGTLPTGQANSVAWSPDGNRLAVAHNSSPYVTIYNRSGDTFTKVSDPGTLPAGNANDVGWVMAETGELLLSVAHATSPYVTIYKYSSGSYVKLSNPGTLPAGTGYGVDFSPDGQYMSVAHATSPYVTIYKKYKSQLGALQFSKLNDPATLPTGTGYSTSFSPDGQYMSVAHATSPYVTIYSFQGDGFSKVTNPATLPTGTGYSTSFSPDGQYMSVAHATSPYVTIYKKDDQGVFIKITDPGTLPASQGNGISWSPDGRYMSVAHNNSPYVTIYAGANGQRVDTTTQGDMQVNGLLRVSGSLGVTGNINVAGSLNVANTSYFNSNLYVSGDLIVDGTYTVRSVGNANLTLKGGLNGGQIVYLTGSDIIIQNGLLRSSGGTDLELRGGVNGGNNIVLNGANYQFTSVTTGNGATAACLSANGSLRAATSTCTNPSSAAYKQNIVSMNDALGILGQLNPVSFDWRASSGYTAMNGGAADFGLIAQEVDSILPNVVSRDENGTIIGLSYQGFIPFLIRGVQQQQEQINAVNNTNTVQQNSINNLNTTVQLLQQSSNVFNNNVTVNAALNVSGHATVGSLTVTGNATVQGDLTVVGNIATGNITVNGHVITAGNAPQVVVGAGAGVADLPNNIAAPQVQVQGNDTSGTITITVGKDVTADELAKLTFNVPFAAKPRVVLTPANRDSAKLGAYYDASAATQNDFSIMIDSPPEVGKTYVFTYFIVQ